jgi:hypothetical protein
MILLSSLFSFAAERDTRIFELRIYHCYPGKLQNLIERFKNHTTRIFEKHKMENIGYWLPVHNENNDLYYILAYPSRQARDSSWNAFRADPEWIEVSRKSEEDGKIVEKVTSVFMNAANIPFSVKASQKLPERVFELRTYYCPPGKLPNLEKRFTDHTIQIFGQHSMESIGYWTTIESDGSQPKLIYIIAHSTEEDAKKSWDAFRSDPNWIKVKADSELNGKIVEKTESVFLRALPFSKIK